VINILSCVYNNSQSISYSDSIISMSRYLKHFSSNFPPEQRRVVGGDINSEEYVDNDVYDEQQENISTSFDDTSEIINPEKGSQKVIQQDTVVFVRSVVSKAIVQGASDIHFEPKNTTYQIRFRIDGALHLHLENSIEEYSMMLNAIKVLADLNIAEHAIPQDGHIELVHEEINRHVQVPEKKVIEHPALYHGKKEVDSKHFYDIRISIFPSTNGETVVMRILNRASALLTIEQLGMDIDSLQKLHDVLLTSYGMLLITGPTGSGKTTTLYSLLGELKNDQKNIITLEDPIEFHLDWLRQCEVREDRGFSFEVAMASVLRQDPDILMVGEIRDGNTAEYAVRSALVGRIVGSTIHANTTVGTIARLLELGIQRSTIAHALNAIIAQRLVRKVCEHCKTEYEPQKNLLVHFGLEKVGGPFYKGKGCEECDHTGYKGRTGIFSVMVFDEIIQGYLFDQKPLLDIENYSIKRGMRTLKMDAIAKILSGVTTVEEASRVI